MDIRNRRAIKSAAAQALAANPGQPRMVVLIYIAVMAVSALLVSALLMALDDRIAQTGGLSDMGLRSILFTIQAVLPLTQAFVLLGMHLGYQRSALNMARGTVAQPQNLLEGFRYFGPLLRSTLLQGGLYWLLSMGASYIAFFLFMMTPMATELITLLEPLLADPNTFYDAIFADQTLAMQIATALMPFFPLFLVTFLAVAAPFFYQYRMTSYCILDAPRRGALAAMAESAMMMRFNRVSLLKLDLSFWWFYLGQALASVVLYGDVLLPLVDVTLPWNPTVNYYVFYVLSLLLQGVLLYFFMNRVETTYATVYDTLRPKPQENPSGGAVLGNIFDLAKDYQED